MAEAAQATEALPRLLGIHLPRMQVEAAGRTEPLLLPQASTQQRQREQAQVAAAADRQMAAEHVPRQRRELDQFAAAALQPVRARRRRSDAVVGVAHRLDRAVEVDTGAQQFVDRPRRLVGHRPRAGAERARPFAGDAGQDVGGAPQVLGEALLAEVRQQAVVVAVAADLVAGRVHLAHQVGQAFGDPAEEEERRLHRAAREQVEQPPRAVAAAQREIVPAGPIDVAGHVQHLEPVLDVDRQGVHRGHRTRSCANGSIARRKRPARAAAAASLSPGRIGASARSRKPDSVRRSSARGMWCSVKRQ